MRKINNRIREIHFLKSNALLRRFLGVALFVLFFIILISIIFYNSIIKSFEKQVVSSEYSSFSSNVTLIENVYNQTKDMLHILGSNNDVQLYFSSKSPRSTNDDYQLGIPDKLHTLKINNANIHSIYLYTQAQSTLCTSENEFKNFNDFLDKDWLYFAEKSVEADNSILVFPRAMRNTYPYVITFIKQMTINQNRCYLVANIDILKLMSSTGTNNESCFYVVDNDKIIYKSDIKNFGTHISQDKILSNISLDDSPISKFIRLGKNKYVFSSLKSEKYGFNYVNVSLSDKYTKGIAEKEVYFYSFLIFAMMFAAILIYNYVKAYYSPIKSLEELLDNKNSALAPQSISPELKNISEKIIHYINLNSELKETLNESLYDIEKLHVQVLQLQINPHFMFNVLNSIYMQSMSDYSCEHNTTKMILLFSRYLKFVLESDKPIVTTADEIYYTKIYVELMKYRYKKLNNVVWDTDASLDDCMIPKLTLQPIVENSIYHGLSLLKDRECELIIRSERVGEKLMFSVRDNGVGMSEEKIKSITDSFDTSSKMSSKHIGLSNICRRIKLTFGVEYGIKIKSEKGKGTEIIIELPLTK